MCLLCVHYRIQFIFTFVFSIRTSNITAFPELNFLLFYFIQACLVFSFFVLQFQWIYWKRYPYLFFLIILELSKRNKCLMSLPSMRYQSASISHWLPLSPFPYKTSNTHLFFRIWDKISFLFHIGCLFCYTMQLFYTFSALFFFLLISSSRGHTVGTVTVDTLTFDKIIQNFDVVLVKFDDKYRMYYFGFFLIENFQSNVFLLFF